MGSQGNAMSPSEEPTTTKAKRVVIVGYNRASLFIPCNPLGRHHDFSLPFGRAPYGQELFDGFVMS